MPRAGDGNGPRVPNEPAGKSLNAPRACRQRHGRCRDQAQSTPSARSRVESAYSPKVIRLRTPNQTRAATLKVLVDNRALIEHALVESGLASVEIVP